MKFTLGTTAERKGPISPGNMAPGSVFARVDDASALIIVIGDRRGFNLKTNKIVELGGYPDPRMPYVGDLTLHCEDER